MKILKFKPTYKKEDGLVVIDEGSVPIPEGFSIIERSVVVFPPGSKGGNHKHPRTELFYTNGNLVLICLDNGVKKEISMAPEDGEYKLFVMSPGLSHVVVNRTNGELIMFEFADEEQHDVETAKII